MDLLLSCQRKSNVGVILDVGAILRIWRLFRINPHCFENELRG